MSQEKAKFFKMTDGTVNDWERIATCAKEYVKGLPDRILAEMRRLDDGPDAFAVGRLEHCLQTATRAYKDGRDEEYVVCALVHDIGDGLASVNHAELGAAILKPYISEKNHWMMENHSIFQGYYFFHYLGLDKSMRDKYKDHPYFEYTAEFCEKYDQNSFDPNYKSMTLEDFEPMLRRLLARPKKSIYKQTEKGKGVF